MVIQNRKWILTAVIVLLICFVVSAGYAQETHKKLYPLLIDLKGWEAEDAEGTSMNMGGMKLINAQRMYMNDDVEIQVSLMVGTNSLMGSQAAMQYEDDDQSMSSSTIDGFTVIQAYDKAGKSGMVTVRLEKTESQSSVLVLTYDGILQEKALTLSKKFDWKKLQAKVKPLM